MAVTISTLGVRFDVDAGEEDASFVRLFQKYIVPFARMQREQEESTLASELDRALGDRAEARTWRSRARSPAPSWGC
jgi:hypothetical protein